MSREPPSPAWQSFVIVTSPYLIYLGSIAIFHGQTTRKQIACFPQRVAFVLHQQHSWQHVNLGNTADFHGDQPC
jgi:hypothetical protein